MMIITIIVLEYVYSTVGDDDWVAVVLGAAEKQNVKCNRLQFVQSKWGSF